jgi:hypothetical protein
VGVDHGGLQVFVPEQLLNGPDIIPLFEQMRGEAVPQGVNGGGFGDPHLAHGLLECPLQGGGVKVMTPD